MNNKNTIWERFLSPIVRFFIDEEKLKQFYESIDWEKVSDRFRKTDLVYPQYYISQNFHGIEGGYLNPSAAASYDPITQYVLPPNENWIRNEAIATIKGNPQRILDLGCGTGSTTLMLQQAFPEAQVEGLDLSPYMLFMADYKAQEAGLEISLHHGKAEATGFTPNSFDLVTASLLFHETPPHISQMILKECFRILKPGGQLLILDGNQAMLRSAEWLTEIFEEPYIKAYAEESVDAWSGAAGFGVVRTENIWGIHQVTSAVKPLADEQGEQISENYNEQFIPAV